MASLKIFEEFILALQEGNVDKVKKSLTKTFKKNSLKFWSNKGLDYLQSAIPENQLEIAKLLISRQCPLSGGRDSISVLHTAVAKGDAATAKALIENGISIIATVKDRVTPFFKIAHRASDDEEGLKILECLLNQGAETESTLLHFVCDKRVT